MGKVYDRLDDRLTEFLRRRDENSRSLDGLPGLAQ